MTANDDYWISKALDLARHSAQFGEVPVGAILIDNDIVIGQGWNQPIQTCDPSAHAEIIALRDGAKEKQNYRLLDTTLYVTLEPCAMCVGAIIQARIKRLVFGAWDPRAGAVHSVFQVLDEPKLNHRVEWVGGVQATECGNVLRNFFLERRSPSARSC